MYECLIDALWMLVNQLRRILANLSDEIQVTGVKAKENRVPTS